MESEYLKRDIKHFLVNLGTTLVVIVFYLRFGFYGWKHLFTILFIHYAAMPLDDWMEGERPFPYYVVPLVAFAVYFYPLITVLAFCGGVIVNLRAITGNNSFLLERFEALGNILVYIVPFTLPVGLNNPQLYIASVLIILFADSFHKIGHQESSKPKLLWLTGLASLLLVAYLFATQTVVFYVLFALTLISLLPFRLIKKKVHSWAYSQVWFGLVAFISFYYYLYFVV